MEETINIEGAIDASNMLKPALARGTLKAIGATTLNEFKKYIEKDAALERRFQQVYVAERLQPPTSFSTISSAYSSIWRNAISPEFWREIIKTGQWKRMGVYAVEAYGVFKVSSSFPVYEFVSKLTAISSVDW